MIKDPRLERKIEEKRRLAEEGETWTVEPRKQSLVVPRPAVQTGEWENAPVSTNADYHAGWKSEGVDPRSLPTEWENQPAVKTVDQLAGSEDQAKGTTNDGTASGDGASATPTSVMDRKSMFEANNRLATETSSSKNSTASASSPNKRRTEILNSASATSSGTTSPATSPTAAAAADGKSGTNEQKEVLFAPPVRTSEESSSRDDPAPSPKPAAPSSTSTPPREQNQTDGAAPATAGTKELNSLRHRIVTLEDCNRGLARRLAQTSEELCVCKATLDNHNLSNLTGETRKQAQPSIFNTLWSDFSRSVANAFGLTELTTRAPPPSAMGGGAGRTRDGGRGGQVPGVAKSKGSPKSKATFSSAPQSADSKDSSTSSSSSAEQVNMSESEFIELQQWSADYAMLEEERNRWISTCNDALLQLNEVQQLLEIKQLQCDKLKEDKELLVQKSKRTLREEMRRYQQRIRQAFFATTTGGTGATTSIRGTAASTQSVRTIYGNNNATSSASVFSTAGSTSEVQLDHRGSSLSPDHATRNLSQRSLSSEELPVARLVSPDKPIDTNNTVDSFIRLETQESPDPRAADRVSMSPREGEGARSGSNTGLTGTLQATGSNSSLADVIQQIDIIEAEEQKTLEEIFEQTDWAKLLECAPPTEEEIAFRAQQSRREKRKASVALLDDKRLVDVLDLSPVTMNSDEDESKPQQASFGPRDTAAAAAAAKGKKKGKNVNNATASGSSQGNKAAESGTNAKKGALTQHFQLEDPEEEDDETG